MEKKLLFFFTFSLFFFLCLVLGGGFLGFKMLYFEGELDLFSSCFLVLMADFESYIFLLMVFLVTSLVSLYSEVYMEFYNSKKFFFITCSFFLSMILLAKSGSVMVLLMGWDGLGITSLCLIMFYPSKTSMFNSFMTFFFNRVGDFALMLVFVAFISSPSYLFFYPQSHSFYFAILILFCSFTKSAQLPFSSWLPAAMSAPTPISAMVHSSTLVTAGIFLLWKNFFLLESSFFLGILFIFSGVTFLLGGLLASLESDLKKVVAFSTMSQISMVIIFISLGLLGASMIHMFFHALFKTLLFCGCGLTFLWIFSDQSSKNLFWPSQEKNSSLLLFISIFSMSGLVFSSSFFSKDIVLEDLVTTFWFPFFLALLAGSILTLLYSSWILSILCSNFGQFSSKASNFKGFSFLFIWVFCFFTSFCSFFLESCTFTDSHSSVSFLMVLVIIFMLLSAFLVSLKKSFMNPFLPPWIFFMKYFFFSALGKVPFMDQFSLTLSDQMMFKPTLTGSFRHFKVGSLMKFEIFFGVLFLMILFIRFT